MCDVKRYKLGDIFDITSSKRIFYSEYVSQGVPFYRSKEVIDKFNKRNIQTELFITEGRYKEIKDKFGVPVKDDILLTSVGTLGIPYIVKEQDRFYFKDGNLTWFRKIKQDKMDVQYFFIWLKSIIGQQKLSEITIGSTQPALTIAGLKEIEILLPELPEQQSIAAVLSSLDDKIDLLHRQNKTLEALAETLFRQWFMEEAEESWETGKLGDVIELAYGKALKEEIRTGTGFSVVGSSGVVGYHAEYLVEGPGIVVGRKGTLGKVIYLFENFFPIDTTYFIKSKVNSVGLFYEYFLLKTLNFEDMNTDSAVPGLNREIALSTEIKKAPFGKLKQYNDYCAPLFEKLRQNNSQIRTLTRLRDTLLPKLMSGEIRVKSRAN